jgi:hypothetical protein
MEQKPGISSRKVGGKRGEEGKRGREKTAMGILGRD